MWGFKQQCDGAGIGTILNQKPDEERATAGGHLRAPDLELEDNQNMGRGINDWLFLLRLCPASPMTCG